MATMSLQQAFDVAVQHHKAGQLSQAESLYRQILARQPNHHGALHLLGVVASELGHNDIAVDLIRKAIDINPDQPAAYINLGNALRESGQFDAAVSAYRQAVELNPGSAQALVNLANALKENGQAVQAITAYRRAITVNPRLPEAHYNLGIALYEHGELDHAIAAYRQAIALKAGSVDAHINLGNALRKSAQLDQAIAAYRQAIVLKPGNPEAHVGLGNVFKDMKQPDHAIASYRQAIASDPRFPESYSNLGNALADQGRLDEAIGAYRQAISLKPQSCDAYVQLGCALSKKGHLDEAISASRQAITLNPRLAQAYLVLGNSLKDKWELDEAIAVYKELLVLEPDHAEAYINLGNALKDHWEFDQAISAYQQGIALKPGFAEAYVNLGNALKDKTLIALAPGRRAIMPASALSNPQSGLEVNLIGNGLLADAIAAYRQAIAVDAQLPGAHYNLADAMLLKGDFASAWPEYEWRWKLEDRALLLQDYTQPQWNGADLKNRRILLHGEQGWGDTLQFARYIPMVLDRGGKVVVGCQAKLRRLLQSNARGWQVIANGDPLPDFDLHCPLLSLPLAFQTTLQSIPSQSPYLQADLPAIQKWKQRLSVDSESLKVGLVWAGSKEHKNDRNRSMRLSALAPLAGVEGVCFYSLQKGPEAQQAAHPPIGMKLKDWTDELDDFADTAGLIANLDLIISVDSAVAHLAGAMGKPVWVMIPAIPDWRWLLEREDSPWYPTMRLFRQKKIGDWQEVMQRVSAALSKFTAPSDVNLRDGLSEKVLWGAPIGAHHRHPTRDLNSPQAHVNLGNILKARGDLENAVTAYRHAIALDPRLSEAHYNLGIALHQQGQIEEAIGAYRLAIAHSPRDADAYVNLGVALFDDGKLHQAISAYRQAIDLNPQRVEAHVNLGNALQEDGKPDAAIAAYRQALTINPHFPQAHRNLGIALSKHCGQLDQAIAAYRQALAQKPEYAEAYNSLGIALCDAGQLDDALAAYRQAIALRPAYAEAGSNLLMTIQYHSGYDLPRISEAHRSWRLQHATPLKRFIEPYSNNRQPERRLRIGYVSPDFRDHPVGRFLLPLLENHDKSQVEVFQYAQVSLPDHMTERLRSRADCWRSIVKLSDARVAELIRHDRIDVLVDLTMHSSDNRLLVFARKPAPVQVTYLAYCSSTGLETIDYRLSDRYLDPIGEDESLYSERTIRLPDSYWCYQPPTAAPQVGHLPAMDRKRITFACLNNFSKVSELALVAWIELLRTIPTAQLVLHAHEGSHRQRVWKRLEREGIHADRLSFVGKVPAAAYFSLYHRIDIALDPFPYGGGTTTCDALWMGVPVISLAGKTAVGRGGLSILSNVGLPELTARSAAEYVRIAIELANDLPRLATLRSTLRQRMERSPLMNAPNFARNIESIYRQMWRTWCEAASL